MFDPYAAHCEVEYRQSRLLQEAAERRLISEARCAAAAPRPTGPTLAWRPALFQLGAWLVGAGRRLQAAAQPRVLAA